MPDKVQEAMLGVWVRAGNELRAAREWYVETFFRRQEGQDFFEYIVIVGFGVVVAGAVAALYMAIRGKFERATTEINAIGP